MIQWAAPAAIARGTAIDSARLDATVTFNGAPLAGRFVYSPAAGTVLNVGSNQTLTVRFTPTDTVDFTAASASVSINVLPPPVTVTSMGLTTVTVGSGRKAEERGPVLRIQFSGALNSNDAQNRATYRAVLPAVRRSLTRSCNNRLKVVSAIYDPQALAVRAVRCARSWTLASPLEFEITGALIPDIYGARWMATTTCSRVPISPGTLSRNGVTLARVMAADVGRRK